MALESNLNVASNTLSLSLSKKKNFSWQVPSTDKQENIY